MLSDRLVAIKIQISNKIANVVTAYAPQTGSNDDEKEKFWQEFGDFANAISRHENMILGQI